MGTPQPQQIDGPSSPLPHPAQSDRRWAPEGQGLHNSQGPTKPPPATTAHQQDREHKQHGPTRSLGPNCSSDSLPRIKLGRGSVLPPAPAATAHRTSSAPAPRPHQTVSRNSRFRSHSGRQECSLLKYTHSEPTPQPPAPRQTPKPGGGAPTGRPIRATRPRSDEPGKNTSGSPPQGCCRNQNFLRGTKSPQR
ncbi:hypothetical protein NDU88_001814 [Pleurodeles waltl]|uniref:Uncharacterized protein n=1 Tax=Pleurodeles waltl TaxID=8319 RepID=A0AAV7KQF6_PLEWA|nr:hypothetical protein NDU88_001814 [Pleurodeles waltl]